MPASGFGFIESDGTVALLVAVVHVTEITAQVVAGGQVAERHAAHDGVAVGRDVGEAVHLLVHVCHVAGGYARRGKQLVGGQVPQGDFLFIESVGVRIVQTAHCIFAVGRHGIHHALIGLAVHIQTGPLACRHGVVRGPVVQQAYHDVAIIGHIEGCTAEHCVGVQPLGEQGGDSGGDIH